MKLTCMQCGHEFEGSISRDALGWHSVCPECTGSFDVDLPEGRIVMAFTNPDYDAEEPYKNFEQDRPEHSICSYYAFASRKQFLDKWCELCEEPDGMWYWVIEGDVCITAGACSPEDIELFCDAWGVTADNPYDTGELLRAAYASCQKE